MSLLQQVFLGLFSLSYYFIHTSFVSYLLILFLFSLLFWYSSKLLRVFYFSPKKSMMVWFFGGLLLFLSLFLAAFIIWFVLFHFHTFSLLSSESLQH